MDRAVGLEQLRQPARPAAADEGLPLRLFDVVLTTMGTLAVAYLVISARWVPGFWPALATFSGVALGPPVFRALARRYPRTRVFEFIASFWLLPSVALGHSQMGAIIDGAHPRLLDRFLANADLKIFGGHPGVFFEQHTPGWLMDVMLACYYTYYLWPILLGLYLYMRRDRRIYDEYILALSVLFALNFIFYVVVPAIGPRFFLADQFSGPLRGGWLTSTLDSMMRGPRFMRDCFPSGHTAGTLCVLVYAFWYARRLFWVMLPVGIGLIAATVVARFHYAFDLMCAVPLLLLAVSTAAALAKVRPSGVVVPAFDLRSAPSVVG